MANTYKLDSTKPGNQTMKEDKNRLEDTDVEKTGNQGTDANKPKLRAELRMPETENKH